MVRHAFSSAMVLESMAELLPRFVTDQPERFSDDEGLAYLRCMMPGKDAERLFSEIEAGMHHQGWEVHATRRR